MIVDWIPRFWLPKGWHPDADPAPVPPVDREAVLREIRAAAVEMIRVIDEELDDGHG